MQTTAVSVIPSQFIPIPLIQLTRPYIQTPFSQIPYPNSSNNQYHPYPPCYNQNIQIPQPIYHHAPYVDCTSLFSQQFQPFPYMPNHTHAQPTLNLPTFTKYTTIEFPKSDEGDLRSCLYKVEQFFFVEEITIHQRMKLVAIHFDGDALQWHQGYVRSRGQAPLPSWEEYVYALADRFGAEYSDPMTELMNVKHIELICSSN
ncbi:uncharacterized protein LOC124887007 [Capsicum annuum]|uniref:uncharacterized protein LOC124887007 n=1 Tax=Capsicum annuum TaxID=4072 RepID=UPI001FB174EC|nr:uncharacterized protein LOC124887007 [Capsicum annuum]